jgi:hypothetical protein
VTTLLFNQRDSGSNNELGSRGLPFHRDMRSPWKNRELASGYAYTSGPDRAGDPGPGRGGSPAQHSTCRRHYEHALGSPTPTPPGSGVAVRVAPRRAAPRQDLTQQRAWLAHVSHYVCAIAPALHRRPPVHTSLARRLPIISHAPPGGCRRVKMQRKGGWWTKSNLTHGNGVASHLTHAEART